ncbi:MAG TPA: cadmium-translocating P-type ATPase [Thermoanaerobacterales bacterium]|nr:cadmium-translocating P-type ATPase [Thermoanaerobacterales bacterium]
MIYELRGLDCPSCASKIERELNKVEGLSDVTLNFATRTIDIEPSFEGEVVKILTKMEPHVKLVPKESFSKNNEADEESRTLLRKKLYSIILSAIFLVIGIAYSSKLRALNLFLEYVPFLVAYFLAGYEVIGSAFKNIARGEIFDENFLMTIATIGAFAIHELPEAVGVMLFFSVGEYFQSLAVARSRSSIANLMDIRSDYANILTDNGIRRVSPEEVKIGETIVVRPGEKVPLDGLVLKGSSYLDTSALTGESVPRQVNPKDKVLAGMVNTHGLLEVKVEKEFGESSVSKILNLVQNASGRKARTEQFITKFARYYTPFVVFSALAIALVPPLVIPGESIAKWVYRALTMLVISCPCALVVSIPLGYFGGIGGASRRGILVKGANYLEALTNVDSVVFDKTGTLTKGVFEVSNIIGANGYSKDEVLGLAAHAEAHSSHPIAKSILKAYKGNVDESLVKDYKEIAGYGIIASVKGKEVIAGNAKLLKEHRIILEKEETHKTIVYIAVDGDYAGHIAISDELRPDAVEAVKELKDLGVNHVAMLTGDNEKTAHTIAKELGLDGYNAELLPQHKVEKLEEYQNAHGKRRKTVFVGDGINDAPVITRADVGIAMGGLGSDAAIEAADVVIMEDMPSKVAEAIRIARHTKKIVIQNIVFALGVKGIFLTLGAAGSANMWQAVFADVGVALLAILNSTRTLIFKSK